MEPNKFNPRDISKYYGRTFMTSKGSLYGITSNGLFLGRKSIDFASIEMVAGIEDRDFDYLQGFLKISNEPSDKHYFDEELEKIAMEVASGLRLAVSLTDESVRNFGRFGLITSPIFRIS